MKIDILTLFPEMFPAVLSAGVIGRAAERGLLDFNVVIQLPMKFTSETTEFELFFKEWNFDMLSPRGHLPYATKREWLEYMGKNYTKEETRVFE